LPCGWRAACMRLPTAVSLLSSPKRAWLLLVMLSVYTARGAHALHFPRNATAHHLGDSDRSRSKGWRCELASNASGSIRPLRRAPKLSFVKFCGPSELQFEQRLRDLPSRSEELHLEPLTEPYVSLSTYTARATHRRLPPSAAINELLRLSTLRMSLTSNFTPREWAALSSSFI
jgi:hypothetical protein